MQDKTQIAVKGSYNPLNTSPILSEAMYTIKVRIPKLESPENYYGPTIYQDNVVGKIVGWMTPGATQNDLNKLSFAITNYKKYVELEETYREIIQSSPFVQWSLIPFLLGANIGLKPITEGLKNDVKSHKEFFTFLVQQGAKYKHCLAGAYGVPSIEMFKSLLGFYGVEASVPEEGTLNLMQLALTSHYDKNAFDKIKELLQAGASINARIDEEYHNTTLHYLIALEHNVHITLEMIDFIEKNRLHFNQQQAWNLDYTLQDKFEKTPLLLAVGLDATKVVEKLLNYVAGKNKRNVGLNIPDVEGRTPCMIAAALGHLDILKQLIKAGANLYLKDKQGRDLMWYANAPICEIRAILESLSIHPDRIASQSHSYLYSSTREAYPVVLVENHTKKEHLLLLSREEPYYNLLKIALKASLKQKDPELNYHYLYEQVELFINKTGESISELKIKNQGETRRYIQETLLRFACAFGDLETIETIISETENFNLESCDHLKRTAMHYAVMTKEIVQGLIKSNGLTCSVEDCLKNHPKVFEFLINKNTNLLDSKNANGNTPLILLQRDANSTDIDTCEQAQIMLGLLKEHVLPSELGFTK